MKPLKAKSHMIELSVFLLAIAVFFAIAHWRLGLLLVLVTAILQDPLRKITPEQPVWFVAFAAIVFAGACLGAGLRSVPLTPNSMFKSHGRIMTPILLLLVLIILEAFNSFIRFGNPMVTSIGLLTYLSPMLAIVFAYQLVLRAGEVRIHQFMKAYVLCIVPALATVYLEYVGYDWPVLGSVGSKLLIYDVGTVIIPKQGIFRTSEIAAWHAMTCACFVVLLATTRKINLRVLLTTGIVVVLLLGIAMLTGRRKALVEVMIFASVYLILWAIFQKRMAKLGVVLAIVGLIGFGWLFGSDRAVGQLGNNFVDKSSSGYFIYVERSKNVFEAIPSRFVELGIAPITWAYDRFGPFGAGLGTGTQGTQYFGAGGGGASEGGLGKIMVELGIPGLFVLGWLAILVFNHLWSIMRVASQTSPRIARLSYGLFSFLVANAAAFSVATQAYGDLFVLLTLSWTLGFLFAIPELLEREARARQPAILEDVAPVFRPKIV
jgi:hypothetical protein